MNKRSILVRLQHKLASDSGETIVETLVSVLVSSLALLMLATAIGASVNIVMRSREYMQQFYTAEASMVEKSQKAGSTPTKKGYTTEVPIQQKVSAPSTTPTPLSSGQVDVYSTEDNTVSMYRGE